MSFLHPRPENFRAKGWRFSPESPTRDGMWLDPRTNAWGTSKKLSVWIREMDLAPNLIIYCPRHTVGIKQVESKFATLGTRSLSFPEELECMCIKWQQPVHTSKNLETRLPTHISKVKSTVTVFFLENWVEAPAFWSKPMKPWTCNLPILFYGYREYKSLKLFWISTGWRLWLHLSPQSFVERVCCLCKGIW